MHKQKTNRPADKTITQLADELPPCDVQAEKALLGAIMIHAGTLAYVDALVVPEDFYDNANMIVFAALRQIAMEGKDTGDVTLLVSRLKSTGQNETVGGVSYINRLLLACGNYANATHYAAIVAEKAKRRRLLATALAIANAAVGAESIDDTIANAATAINAVERGDTPTVRSIGEVAREVVRMLEHRMNAGTTGPSAYTGILRVDESIGGFAPEELIVLAARAGNGKSTFALNAAMHTARSGRNALFVSLEMASTELVMRRLAGEAGVDSRIIRSGDYTRDELSRVVDAAAGVSSPALSIWSPRETTVDRLAAVCRMCQAAGKLSMVVVDYLNLITPPDRRRPRVEQVDDITKGLKRLAREIRCPVMALAQLNREAEGEEPRLSHLRESGAIEQDADMVIFLHAPNGPNSPNLDVIVAKHRFGERCKVGVKWDRATGLFSDEAQAWDGGAF